MCNFGNLILEIFSFLKVYCDVHYFLQLMEGSFHTYKAPNHQFMVTIFNVTLMVKLKYTILLTQDGDLGQCGHLILQYLIEFQAGSSLSRHRYHNFQSLLNNYKRPMDRLPKIIKGYLRKKLFKFLNTTKLSQNTQIRHPRAPIQGPVS